MMHHFTLISVRPKHVEHFTNMECNKRNNKREQSEENIKLSAVLP